MLTFSVPYNEYKPSNEISVKFHQFESTDFSSPIYLDHINLTESLNWVFSLSEQ